jgi:hypothetical protein
MSLDDPDLQAYRDFVGIMLAKDQNDPVSWLQYSLMHGQYNGNYRYCPHGDWYFLPHTRHEGLAAERRLGRRRHAAEERLRRDQLPSDLGSMERAWPQQYRRHVEARLRHVAQHTLPIPLA